MNQSIENRLGENTRRIRKYTLVQVGDKKIEVETNVESGCHLYDLSDWNEEVAYALAHLEGVKLGPQPWSTIRFLREFYLEYQIAPSRRVFIGAQRKAGLNLELEPHFPKGISQACGIAGLPYPNGIEVDGKVIEVDEEGYLRNFSDWTPEFTEMVARGDGLNLTDDHWLVINYMREYYRENQIEPALRFIYRDIGKKLGLSSIFRRMTFRVNSGIKEYLEQQFPDGGYRQLRKYAGIMQPSCLQSTRLC